MLLKQILGEINWFSKYQKKLPDVEVCGISKDSTTCKKGELYFCLTNDFDKAYHRCKQALENGAVLAVSNFPIPFDKAIEVDDCRNVFANACANFYQRACDDLKIVGVSGTNGKTTTTHLVAEMLKRSGRNAGVIGTSGVFYNGKTLPSPLTTPDADFLHKTFLDMKNSGVEYVIMEVSAHAIDQKRINGIKFDVGVLTNITQDHLDYFHTFEAYEKTKLSFFSKEHIKCGIVCADDRCASKLIGNADVPILSYGLKNPCDAFAIDVCCSMNGSHFVGNICDSVVDIKTNLIGEYNIYNSLAALTICKQLGLDDNELVQGLSYINPVEGRFNVVNMSGNYVVIDYAHTPDGIYNVLKAARELTDKNLYIIFGCGGNRDKSKRSKMGCIAEKYADYVCLTDDNPRMENSMDIIADIEKGMEKPHFVESDRYTAIKKMLDMAGAGDIIVVAGKGAEKYQEVGKEKRPYNDFDAVYRYFKEKDPITQHEGRHYEC